jgi:two-component system, response regulator / RNA-binding antiterminator
MLKVMMVGNDVNRSKPLMQSLLDNGFEVLAHVSQEASFASSVLELMPDLLIIDCEFTSQSVLENISHMNLLAPRPVVMFSQEGDKAKIKAATQAGVSAYVVGSIPPERLRPLIDAAIARFEEFECLRNELMLVNTKLDERKVVERAKGLLMRQRAVSEEDAYSMLRSMAMQKNMKLADLSQQLIQAAEMLIM